MSSTEICPICGRGTNKSLLPSAYSLQHRCSKKFLRKLDNADEEMSEEELELKQTVEERLAIGLQALETQ